MYDSQDTEISSEKKVKKFREETNDGIDQNIFRPRPTKKPVKNKKLQKQLDDTEFQVELKADKKKRRKK